jgi:NAD(P)-dependent dehydrogenase (short-subunit alcohol dehydrogenase family)
MVSAHMSPEIREARVRGNALATEGTAWDIARAALFLTSDDARWVTGVCLPVDGGMLQANPFTVHGWLSA